MFENFWSQISKKAMLKDVKKRVVDHLKAKGLNISEEDARMWLYTHDKENVDNQMRTRAGLIPDGFKNPPTDLGDDYEPNSGIEFPGQSLEPLLGSALRMSMLNS